MRKVNDLLLAVLAGSAISFGGTVFLSLENKVLGSLFFSIGLFMVCTLKLNLFTGKAKDKKISILMYILTVLFILKYIFL